MSNGNSYFTFFILVMKSAQLLRVKVLSMLSFTYIYYLSSSRYFSNYSKVLKITLSALVSSIAFLFLAYLIQKTRFNLLFNILLPTIGVTFFVFVFRKIPDTIIEKSIKLSFRVLCLRAVLAATIILFVTEIAKFLDPSLAGALSSFPTTLLPLLLIIHFSYLDKNVYTVIKNVPYGAYSLVLYSLLVSQLYPRIGVAFGTIFSLLLSLLYLYVQSKFLKIETYSK